MHTAVTPMVVVTPRTLDDALAFLDEHAQENWIPLAGGTDLLVLINNGPSPGERFLDLGPLRRELNHIARHGENYQVGALATMTELRRACAADPGLPPLIARAASVVGGIQIQNRATVGGNIANASPAGDTLPVWAVLDAEVLLRSVHGERWVPFHDFYRGYRTLDRRPEELLVGVRFRPLGAEYRTFFHKVGTRAAQAISKVVLAGAFQVLEGRFRDVRLAAGSVAPVPTRLRGVEARLEGREADTGTVDAALAHLAEDISPIDDIRSTGEYRFEVAANLLKHYLDSRI